MPRKKNFYYNFNIDDWEGDTDRLKMSRANSDTWHSVINIMYKTRNATIEGPREHLAKMLRLTPEEFDNFFEELRTSGTATKAVITNVKISARKAAQVLGKSRADVARMSGQRQMFVEFVSIYKIYSRNVDEKLKSKKGDKLQEGEQPAQKLRGTKSVPAHVPIYKLSSYELKVNTKSSSSSEEESTHSLTHSQKTNFRPPKGQTREEFLAELAKDPRYRHIGGTAMLDRELVKAEEWCRKNRRHCTPTRFKENWLDRIDPPAKKNHGNNRKTKTVPGGTNGNSDRESAADIAKRIGADIR